MFILPISAPIYYPSHSIIHAVFVDLPEMNQTRQGRHPPPPPLKERLPALASWLFHFGEFSYPPPIKVSLWLFVTKEYRAHRNKVLPIDHAIFMFLFLFSLLFRHAFFISNAFFNSALVLLNFFMNCASNSG